MKISSKDLNKFGSGDGSPNARLMISQDFMASARLGKKSDKNSSSSTASSSLFRTFVQNDAEGKNIISTYSYQSLTKN